MKLNKTVVALALAAPLSIAHADTTDVSNYFGPGSVPWLAGVGVSGFGGWQGEFDHDGSAKHYKQSGSQSTKAYGPWGRAVNPYDDGFWGGSLSYELTPWLTTEAEFSQKEGDGSLRIGPKTTQPGIGTVNVRTRQYSGNALINSDLFGLSSILGDRFKPYVLVGAGYQALNVNDKGFKLHDASAIVNLGAGAFYRINDVFALRGEGRVINEAAHGTWDYKALAGLTITPWGHKGYKAPPPPVVEPPAPTPVPVPVPVPPPVVTEDLKLELRVFFDTNKSIIKKQYQPEIAKVADKLKDFPNASAEIRGYTDSTGPKKLNDRLSQARADAVKKSLTKDYGIDAGRLTAKGYSWNDPVASNKTKEGRALNRRVVAVITGSRTVQQ